MDGTFAAMSGRDGVVLQRFITDRAPVRRALYWRDGHADAGQSAGVTLQPGGALLVEDGGVLQFDTYFNGFHEAVWRRHTALRNVVLRVTLSGTAMLRVYRHSLDRKVVLSETLVGPGTARVSVPGKVINFRELGMVSAELTAVDGACTFLSGAWLTEDPPVAEVGLAAVFCTFNREADIARVLQSIGADRPALEPLARVFVVNQGRPELVRHPGVAEAAELIGDRLSVIEQANFGGAGGFSRGLLAALADPAITHAVLLDDDLELEPDTLLRMAAFYSFCERDVLLGGHMLDQLQPTLLYEAGAVIADRHWHFLPQHFARDIADAKELELLSRPYAIHYNGWWCCGVPLRVLREHGMPLPCFIRGDDVEFGLRLHERGVPTVPLPGAAVWHEPFYLKLGNWQLYYETRNTLVSAALHLRFDRIGVVRRMGRQVVTHLLTERDVSTALILQGIEDFLVGPSVMRAPPLPRHESLSAIRAEYNSASTPREKVLSELPLLNIPNGAVRNLSLIGWLLIRNAVMPPVPAAPQIMPVENLHCLTMRRAPNIAVETWWDDQLPTFCHSRDRHRRLLRKSVRLLLRLFREAPRAAAAWREAAPGLTSVASWHDYLGVVAPLTPDGSRAGEAEARSLMTSTL